MMIVIPFNVCNSSFNCAIACFCSVVVLLMNNNDSNNNNNDHNNNDDDDDNDSDNDNTLKTSVVLLSIDLVN